jgi:two-component system OmpR family sensor kinase
MHGHLTQWWNAVSLRTKITGVTVMLLTLGLAVAGLGTMSVLRDYLLQELDTKIATNALKLTDNTVSFNYELTDCTVEADFTDYYLAVVDADGREMCSNLASNTVGPEVSELDVAHIAAEDGSFTLSNEDRTSQWRVMAYPLANDDQVTVLIGLQVDSTNQVIARYAATFLFFALTVVILGGALTRLLVTSTFHPLREVEETAARFAAGDFSQRLDGANPDTEVGRLNESLNTMLSRIDSAFGDRSRTIDQMRRFVGDASHELRTPLVSVRGYAELYRMGALTTPEDVAQAMERIEKEAIRMGALVQDLLSLARLDEAKPLDLAPVDLIPLASDAAMDAMASSPGRAVRVIVTEPILAPPPAPAPAEPEKAVRTTGTFGAGVFRSGNTANNAGTNPSGSATGGSTGSSSGGSSGGSSASNRPPTDPNLSLPTEMEDASGAPVATTTNGSTTRGGRAAQQLTGPIGFAGNALARLRARRPRPGKDVPENVEVESVSSPSSATVLAEENKIRQVLTNLMGNAMRFAPDGTPIEITVTVDEVRDVAIIGVVDHGEGIPPQIREKIFQRFWRADSSRNRDTGGSGLGLAIVASIVDSHKGSVDVIETPGGGATFRVFLPLLHEEPTAAGTPTAS